MYFLKKGLARGCAGARPFRIVASSVLFSYFQMSWRSRLMGEVPSLSSSWICEELSRTSFVSSSVIVVSGLLYFFIWFAISYSSFGFRNGYEIIA